jgi:hypothetical protein
LSLHADIEQVELAEGHDVLHAPHQNDELVLLKGRKRKKENIYKTTSVGPVRGLRGGGRRGWCEEWARRG